MFCIGAAAATFRAAGGTIAIAPAEVPFGKGDQAFFSALCKRTGAT
jgi:hypothetical protein